MAPETDKTAAAPEAAAAQPAAAPKTTWADTAKAAAVDALLEPWIASLRDGPLAQHTPAWNALVASLPDLKAAVLKHGG